MLVRGQELNMKSGSKVFSQSFYVIELLYSMELHNGILTVLSIFR